MNRYSYKSYMGAQKSEEDPISSAFSPAHQFFHNLSLFTHALMGDSYLPEVKKIFMSHVFVNYMSFIEAG